MIPIQEYTIQVPQGSDRLFPVYIKLLTDESIDFDPVTNPFIPKDLTGYTAKMTVKEDYTKPDIILSYTSEDNLLIDPVNGLVNVTVLGLDTQDLIIDEEYIDYIYDLEIVLGTYVQRILTGNFRINAQV